MLRKSVCDISGILFLFPHKIKEKAILMDEATPLTPFDTMTQTREIQMLKNRNSIHEKVHKKKQFAILIKV
ncbi:hypothetical protein ROSEINA2194_03827 [Roseburia inulinivorans DSM 16841]|uniref:Uncharacterized protein n=1 Tax=Roseburia inulinivorans DSM 16841 TaxID=622312 RepID=C0FYI8_9FIRM|nr:hypothetical protein ROSEINA2194_03827 [Roseburia inulinivorans DSM 16841]